MLSAPWVGLVGDVLTFVGSSILAYDAVTQEQAHHRIRTAANALKHPGFAKLRIEARGVIIRDETDVEIGMLRSSSKRAVVGIIIVTTGFLFLVAFRALEVIGNKG